MTCVARLILALIVPASSCGSLCNLSESDAEGLVQIHAKRLVDDPYSQRDRLHRRHRRQQRRQHRRYRRWTTTTTTTLLPDVITLMKELETSREALEATFAALADSLTSNDARLVRDLSDKWFSTSGSTLLATDFVINYAANDTYYNNNVGLVDALNTIAVSLSGSVSLLQSRAFAVDDNLADSCCKLFVATPTWLPHCPLRQHPTLLLWLKEWRCWRLELLPQPHKQRQPQQQLPQQPQQQPPRQLPRSHHGSYHGSYFGSHHSSHNGSHNRSYNGSHHGSYNSSHNSSHHGSYHSSHNYGSHHGNHEHDCHDHCSSGRRLGVQPGSRNLR
ncbi:bromodomain-containing protein 4A-like isoform X4 [Durusdinium trenchii]|uniref:Bromodomain-containing protein 4A-like isoform X4 n=1 Tax=Durusdinium trenchii TaxID=1381693 RepID=A0ABP0QV86_9DINO